jgi:hypothetical protein
MRSFRKDARIAVLVLVAALTLAQAIRVERSNPPARSDISADPAVGPLLRRACYDCHSNETNWPWYSNVAPASWLVSSDVNEGRSQLNFSEWENYGRDAQARKLKEIAEEMRDGDMPPWYYSVMHRNARLNSAERSRIQAWTAAKDSGMKQK